MDDGRWTNAQKGPGLSASGTGSCASHSAKPTLRSPGRIISFPQVCLYQHPGLYSGYCGHAGQPWLPAGDRPLAQAFCSTGRASARQAFDARVTEPGPSQNSLEGPSRRRKAVTQRACPMGLCGPTWRARSPSHSHPAHRKWLSTVSFVACLGSPVMNRVRLTYQTKTPGRKVTRTSQSADGRDPISHPVPSSPCPCPLERPAGTQQTQSCPL